MERIVSWRGMQIKETTTIPGTIFSVSAMMDNEEDPDTIGYDGESGVHYGKLKLQVMSDDVRTRIVEQKRSSILSFWAKVGAGVRSNTGDCVESLFRGDLSKSTYRMKRWKMQGKRNPTDNAEVQVLTGTLATSKLATIETINGCIKDNRVYRMKKNCPVIDFAGPGRRVYQVTVSDNHSLSISGAANLLMNLGYLVMKDETYVLQVPPPPMLEFYWVVPYQSESAWKGRQPKSATGPGSRELKKLVDMCLTKYVQQFVLIMENEEPVP
jgi:hypothetical protein